MRHLYRFASSWGAPTVAGLFLVFGSLLVFGDPVLFWFWGLDLSIMYRFLLPVIVAMAMSARFPKSSLLLVLLVLLGQFSAFLPTLFGVINLPTYFGLTAVFFFAAFNGNRLTLVLSTAAAVLSAAGVGVLATDQTTVRWGAAAATPWVKWGSYFGEAPQYLVLFLLAVVAGYALRSSQERSSLQAEKVAAEELRRRTELDLARSEERNRISHELHDVLGHSLAVVIAQADGARYLSGSKPEAVDRALADISSAARSALLSAQEVVSDSVAQTPGVAELPDLLEGLRGIGLNVAWTEQGDRKAASGALQLALYRIIQESLTNALKHGGSDAKVQAELRWQQTQIELSIVSIDGTNPAELPGSGQGIPGMLRRAAQAGGWLTAEPAENGFDVQAVFPIRDLNS